MIYERPMAGLMVPSENHVDCTEDEAEDVAFWENLFQDPVLRGSIVEELVKQDNFSTAEVEDLLVNITNASDALLGFSRLGWHHHHGWGGWGWHHHHHHFWGGWGWHHHHHHHWRRLRGSQ